MTMMSDSRPHILVLGGDVTILELLSDMIDNGSRRISAFTCDDQALDRLTALQPDLLVLDLVPERGTGLVVLDALRGCVMRHVPLIILSTQQDELRRAQATMGYERPCAVLAAPFDMDHLLALVSEALAPGLGATRRDMGV